MYVQETVASNIARSRASKMFPGTIDQLISLHGVKSSLEWLQEID
jgi:hypothetical protein